MKIDLRKTVKRLNFRQAHERHERLQNRYERVALWLIRVSAAIIAIGMIYSGR